MNNLDAYGPDAGQKRLAKISGALFALIALLGMVGPGLMQSFVVRGDADATAARVAMSAPMVSVAIVLWLVLLAADAAAAITLHGVFGPASRTLSLLTAALRVVYVAVAGAGVSAVYQGYITLAAPGSGLDAALRHASALTSFDAFSGAFVVALTFFGIHITALGVLLDRSGYVPRALASLVVIAGASYLVHSVASFFITDQTGLASAALLGPAAVGEIALTVWLLTKGVNASRTSPGIPALTAQPARSQSAGVGMLGGAS